MAVKIIDAAIDVRPYLAKLRQDTAVDTIIRYDDRFVAGDWKQLHLAECKATGDAGFKVAIVYEHGNDLDAFTERLGYLDCDYSRRMAAARGQPAGSAIFFACDADMQHSQITPVTNYFRGVYKCMAEVRPDQPALDVGCYGSGFCHRILRQTWPDILRWITCSLGFEGSAAAVKAGDYEIFQGWFDAAGVPHSGCDKKLVGLDCDFNTARIEDWGWFIPGGLPAPVPAPPPVVAHDARWLQTRLQAAGFYHGDIDGDVGPQTIAAMIADLEAHPA